LDEPAAPFFMAVREAGSQEMLVSVKQYGITSYMPVFFIQEHINKRPYLTRDDYGHNSGFIFAPSIT